ncbi:MAG: adenylyltransferase/cytidyltransferase family protein, partial [Candidatus Aenigmatarchaeota archaeon]
MPSEKQMLSRKLPVFAGRFQPLHKGHLEVMRRLSKGGRFAVVIGSVQEFGTDKNPFNFAERKEMIEGALKEAGIKNFRIYGVVDFLR